MLMKLNWFSPIAPAQTDIAHYTERVIPALSQVADVTIWADQRNWNRRLAELAEVKTYRVERMRWMDLNRADANIFHIGNNPQFHGPIWQVSRQLSGVVVLHDLRLHHFFDGIYRVKLRDLNSYLAVMSRYYGDAGRQEAMTCYRSNARNIDYMAERYPLTELAIENASGVLVHTKEAFDLLNETLHAPLAYAPLPFPSPDRGSSQSRGDAKVRLVLFGYIGRNRRLSSVLNALSALEEKDRFHLDVFGTILNDERELRSQISTLGLKQSVTLHGFADERKLDEALSECDLAINLRFPTMGEASGSQLRIWSHGRASLVSNVGWYASLPEGTAAVVRTDENEVADIQRHLRTLLTNPEVFAAMGMRGRRELETNHAPESYARAILQIAEESIAFRARQANLKLAERSALASRKWITPALADDAFRRVATEVQAFTSRSLNADRS
jgi:glycosyltransferase involved in cell wall biosynthesis